MLDGFVTQYCKAYQALGLFGPEHCHPDSFSSLDYEGKVLVLSPDILKESYWNEGAMLWYAHDGLGAVLTPSDVPSAVPAWAMGR